MKHACHIHHIGHVPIIEGLVEGACVAKYISHIRHIGHVPLIEGLVEGFCFPKNTEHTRHIGHVPIANFAVFCHNSFFLSPPAT